MRSNGMCASHAPSRLCYASGRLPVPFIPLAAVRHRTKWPREVARRVLTAAVLRKEEKEKQSSVNKHSTHHSAPQLHHQARAQQLPESLFPVEHVPQLDPLFVLYFPIGVVIAAVRIGLWVALLLLDLPWLTDNDWSIAVLQAILGVQVEWRNVDGIPEGRHVLVSNHVTTGDMMALYRRPRRIVHLISTGLPKRVAESRHHRVDLRHASVENYDRLAQPNETDPVHLFPEGGMTNGTGMMKFSRGFLRFADGIPVVPVALRARLPWNISTHTLDSNFLANLFWFCFCPYVSLQLTVLPAASCKMGESRAKFVERVQRQIAGELQIPIHDFPLQAKKQLIQSSKKARH